MAWSLSAEERAQVRGIFLELDTRREGVITMEQLQRVLQEEFQVSYEEVQAIFSAMDVNQNEEIHYSEFLAAMCSSKVAMHEDLISQAFRRFDTDNSGVISLENLKDLLGESFENTKVEEILGEVPHESFENTKVE